MGAQNGQRGFPPMGQFGAEPQTYPGQRPNPGGARPGPSMGGEPSFGGGGMSGGGMQVKPPDPMGGQFGGARMGPGGMPISVGENMYPGAATGEGQPGSFGGQPGGFGGGQGFGSAPGGYSGPSFGSEPGAYSGGQPSFGGGGMSGGGMQVKPPDFGQQPGPIFQQRKPTFGGMPAPTPVGGLMGQQPQGLEGRRGSPFGNRPDMSRLFRQR